jgi:hypothetical protein
MGLVFLPTPRTAVEVPVRVVELNCLQLSIALAASHCPSGGVGIVAVALLLKHRNLLLHHHGSQATHPIVKGYAVAIANTVIFLTLM